MDEKTRDRHALSAALVIQGELEREPEMTGIRLLSLLHFTIMHAMAEYRAETQPKVEFSNN